MEKIDLEITEEDAILKLAEICKTTPDELIAFVHSLFDKYELDSSDFEGSA